jgi:plastocyanin
LLSSTIIDFKRQRTVPQTRYAQRANSNCEGDSLDYHRRAITWMLAALGATTAAPAFAQGKNVEVTMKNDPKGVFVPATVNIRLDDTVNWTNPGLITHTVTFDPAQAVNKEDVDLPAGALPFASNDMEEDATFSHIFTVKGTYKYVCKYHEAMGMVGTVIVS